MMNFLKNMKRINEKLKNSMTLFLLLICVWVFFIVSCDRRSENEFGFSITGMLYTIYPQTFSKICSLNDVSQFNVTYYFEKFVTISLNCDTSLKEQNFEKILLQCNISLSIKNWVSISPSLCVLHVAMAKAR